jgi:hypothetical protein
MSEAKVIADKVVAEVKDSAHLFFTPVRVFVNEFTKAVHQPSRDSESQKSPQGPARAG